MIEKIMKKMNDFYEKEGNIPEKILLNKDSILELYNSNAVGLGLKKLTVNELLEKLKNTGLTVCGLDIKVKNELKVNDIKIL